MITLPSPHATKILNHISHFGYNGASLGGMHSVLGMKPDEFERGLNWLIHFKKIEKFVSHGATCIRRVNA